MIRPLSHDKTAAKLKRYELALKREKARFGCYDDSAGKRYLLGQLYMQLGDVEGALKSFKWYSRVFPDDCGEPYQYLTWALTLFAAGKMEKAEAKLMQADLRNLYMIPELLGREVDFGDLDIGSSWDHEDYIDPVHEAFVLWDEKAKEWVRGLYDSPRFTQVRGRYVAIQRELADVERGPRRSALVAESYGLLKEPFGKGGK